jgi:hypothetical protein
VAIGIGPALILAFYAMVRAAGGRPRLFAHVAARVSPRDIPIADLAVIGLLITVMELFATTPSLGGLRRTCQMRSLPWIQVLAPGAAVRAEPALGRDWHTANGCCRK